MEPQTESTLPTELLENRYPVSVERTIVHNKRIAPKGHVFFVVKAKNNHMIYTNAIIVRTANLVPEDEVKLKSHLKIQMCNYIDKKA